MNDKALVKALSDQYWRLNNLYFIVDKSSRKVLFKMNPAQEFLFRNFHNFSVILKARQIGFSTFFQILALDMCLFNSNYNAGLICANLNDAKTVLRNKVKFSYNNLHPMIQQMVPADTNSAGELSFANNSCLSVGTSYRGSTPMFLHVSELAKISAKYPERALEIQTGAFNSVPSNGILLVESTAEGASGLFYEICQEAIRKKASKTPLSEMDFKFFFFPWHEHDEYVSNSKVVYTTEELEHFENIQRDIGKKLTNEQKAFYTLKWRLQGDKIFQEYPSTPEEAFRSSIKGAYYRTEMLKAREEGRICHVPFEKALNVHTAWDLGVDDHTVIWFYQIFKNEVRTIDYYENNDAGLEHYVNKLRERQKENGYRYDRHFFPHDVNVKELGSGIRRIDTLKKLGVKARRIENKISLADGIEASRQLISRCWFDESKVARGIECLENYKKRINRSTGEYTNEPAKDGFDHGADGFRMLAISLGKLKKTKGVTIF